jgi:hypothetical protein
MQCFLYLSICCLIVGGISIILMKYVGREDNIEFTISSLPTCVKKFDVELTLLSILCTRGRKFSTLGLAKEAKVGERIGSNLAIKIFAKISIFPFATLIGYILDF